jgi:hypothetical protein
MTTTEQSIDLLRPDPANPRRITPEAATGLGVSMGTFGDIAVVTYNERTGELVAGHQRMAQLRAAGATTWHRVSQTDGYVDDPKTGERFRVRIVDWDPTKQRAANLVANNPHIAGEYSPEALAQLKAIEDDVDYGALRLDAMQASLEAAVPVVPAEPGTGAGSLAERFGVPPFSVLDARQGYWQDRKRAWLALGIRGELGQGADRLTWVAGARDQDDLDETSRKILAAQPSSGTSIFDPVLCELVYSWFSGAGAAVLDPFAGGSVRGIVAAKLGRPYAGIELRAEQVEANREQATTILGKKPAVAWYCGDALDMQRHLPKDFAADLVFSCPPYADLEVYSDDPRDISTLAYPKFLEAYRSIIGKSIKRLRPNRFACFCVGDVRDKKGFYRGFVSDTIAAFEVAGARLYNEAILVTAVGSLPLRVGKQFEAARKLGKTHQNVLVFCKGDPRKASLAAGRIALDLPVDEIPLETAPVPPAQSDL